MRLSVQISLSNGDEKYNERVEVNKNRNGISFDIRIYYILYYGKRQSITIIIALLQSLGQSLFALIIGIYLIDFDFLRTR